MKKGYILLIFGFIIIAIGVVLAPHKTSTISQAPQTPSEATTTANTVTGMTKFTDKEFGFSFWYPSTWHVTPLKDRPFGAQLAGGNVVKSWSVGQAGTEIVVQAFHSTLLTITDTGGAGPFGPIKYFFDPKDHAWKVVSLDSNATTTITTFNNTMGGLHMFNGTSRFNTRIIPISADNFVVIGDGGGTDSTYLSKTVVALDPDVAKPLSDKDQNVVIKEAADYYNKIY
jgi:hypothetical protein